MTNPSSTIPPALTPEEWKDAEGRRGDFEFGYDPGHAMWLNGFDEGIMLLVDEMPVGIAVANAALPADSPYKLTRADVTAIETLYRFVIADPRRLPPDVCDAIERHYALAAKLAALLPPE